MGLCLQLPSPAAAQRYPTLLNQRFYGTPREDHPKRMVRDAQGNVYIFGAVADTFGRTDFLAIKLGPDGNQLWQEVWGGVGFDAIHDACINRNGEIYIVGVTGTGIPHTEDPFPDRKADYYVAKISPEGNRLWARTIGGSGRDVAYGITATNFDGIAVTGMTWSRDHDVGTHDLALNNQWLVILNGDGRVLRSKVLGGKKNDWGSSISVTPDGGFVVGGVTNSEDLDFAETRHNGDAWFMKLDFAGNMQWSQIVRKPYEDIIYRVVCNRYGLTVAVGSQVTPEGGKQFWLLKLDERGRVVIDKQLGGYGFEELLGVDICEDGGVVMVGYSEYLDLNYPGTRGLRDVWVVRTDAQGNLLWMKSFGGPASEMGIDVMEFEPGVIKVLCQKANTFGADRYANTGQDCWVMTISDQPCREVQLDVITDMTDPRTAVGTPIRFVNRSTQGENWEWDFGDGTTSAERSPIKVYRTPGVYTVRLTATVNETCRTVFFYPKPVIITP